MKTMGLNLKGRGACVDMLSVQKWGSTMTPTEIIRESDGLPPMERLQVVRYAQQLETNGHLSGVELGALAQRMVDAKNPVEAARLKAEIVKDYYGDE